jgi:aspartate/methionine/tyrosine aminotransferase
MINLSTRAANIKRSGILEIDDLARSLEAQKKQVTKLHIGNMWQRTDDLIISKAHEAMLSGRTGYEAVGSCIPEFADALVDYYKRKYGVRVEKEWIITGPSVGLTNQTVDCLLQARRKVGIVTPAWEVYFSQVSETLATVKPIPMKFSEGSWSVSEFSGKGTDLFVMADPNNPTSSVLDEESRQTIISGVSETKSPIIVDLAYDNLYWDCDFKPLLQYDEIADRVIAIGSFSKSHRMAGWRMGYLVSSNKKFLATMRDKVRKDWTCVPPFIQCAAAYGLSSEFEQHIMEWRETVRKISKKTVEILKSFGLECVEPQGTIYAFANVGMNSVKFARQLLDVHGIATVPGKYFGENAARWIRITTVAVPEERLYPAVETIGRLYQNSRTR